MKEALFFVAGVVVGFFCAFGAYRLGCRDMVGGLPSVKTLVERVQRRMTKGGPQTQVSDDETYG